MHRCTGKQEQYYWPSRCRNGKNDCQNREDESRSNPKCNQKPNPGIVPPTETGQTFAITYARRKYDLV